MAMKKSFNMAMLIFMVYLIIEKERMAKVVEASFCWSPSRSFHGICIRHRTCDAICEQEGFATGECKGLIDRRCMCGGDCGGANPPPGWDFPPPPPEEWGNPPPEGDFTPEEALPPSENFPQPPPEAWHGNCGSRNPPHC